MKQSILSIIEQACVATLVAALVACTPDDKSSQTRVPVLRGIDHFFATSDQPERLYRVFRDSLQLPEVYPFRNYGDFTSGVLSAGNVLFEVVTWAIPAGERMPTEFKGLAFEPEARLPETFARLRAAGALVQKPESVWFTNSAGVRDLGYVNISLDGPSGLQPVTASIFINDNLGKTGPVKHREDGAHELARRNGGPLGIVSIDELIIGVPDVDSAMLQWRALGGTVAPNTTSVMTWSIGPRMRFVQAPRAAIQETVVRVRSLESARLFLTSRNMLSTDRDRVCIAPAAIDGLRMCLVE
jgi:hypothetical protein